MRRVAWHPLLCCLLLLANGCQLYDPTRLWKLNRGENYMNDDGQYSVPAQQRPTLSTVPEAERPE